MLAWLPRILSYQFERLFLLLLLTPSIQSRFQRVSGWTLLCRVLLPCWKHHRPGSHCKSNPYLQCPRMGTGQNQDSCLLLNDLHNQETMTGRKGGPDWAQFHDLYHTDIDSAIWELNQWALDIVRMLIIHPSFVHLTLCMETWAGLPSHIEGITQQISISQTHILLRNLCYQPSRPISLELRVVSWFPSSLGLQNLSCSPHLSTSVCLPWDQHWQQGSSQASIHALAIRPTSPKVVLFPLNPDFLLTSHWGDKCCNSHCLLATLVPARERQLDNSSAESNREEENDSIIVLEYLLSSGCCTSLPLRGSLFL